MSFPLNADGTSAALNLYAKKENAFDESTTVMGQVFANQAAIALQNARTYMAARKVADQLNEALKTRDLIGQAKGILMEREGVSDEEAFDMLKTISQNSNVKLRDIAQKLVAERASAAN
jgi:AmiR/NasT family two-component response regulator